MIKRIMAYIPAVGIPIVINFVLMYLYSNSMTLAEYGTLNIYMNTISLVYALFLSFFQSSALRFYSIEDIKKSEKVYYSTYVFGNIVVSIVSIVIMFMINVVLFKFDFLIIGTAVGINALYQFDLNYYRLQNKDKSYIWGKTVTSVLTLVFFCLCYMLLTRMNYRSTLVSVYASYLLLVIIELIKNRDKLSITEVSFELLKQSLMYGLPMVGVSIAGILVANSDQYVLLYFMGEEAVGNYSLGYRLSDSLIVNITLLILTVMTPELMRVYDKGKKEESEKTLSKMINFNIWATLPLVGAMMVYAPYIIKYIFPQYQGAEIIMKLVVLASFFHSLSLFTCKPLELVRKTMTLLWLLLITAVVNFLYNIIFVPMYGINASAHSSIITYILYNFLLIVAAHKYLKIKFDLGYIMKNLATLSVTVFVAVVMVSFFGVDSIVELFVQVLTCSLIYISMSLILKIFSINF